MNIIALDDEEYPRRTLVKAIRSAAPDADVYDFENPFEALAFSERNHIDVAFLDIQMPMITGLEVARKMKKLQPDLNIIFVTAYSEYAVEAFEMRSSGYLMKPISQADVKTELEHLRNPVQSKRAGNHIEIRTFGSFDIFVDGKALVFRREKAKEVLAYLVDRRGSTVTRKELAAVIFEDKEYSRATQTYLTQIISNLRKTLEDAGIGQILENNYNTYAVDTKRFSCDAYEYLDGSPAAMNQFRGEYMNQYSWSEESKSIFFE